MSATTLRPRGSIGTTSLPRVGNSTAVLLAALGTVAATAWAVMSAGWVDGTGAMLLAAMAAVLEAALVARSSVGRLVALLLLPVVGTLVVVPLTYGSMPGADNIAFGDAVQQYVDALTTGLFVQADWAFLVGLCGVFWLIGSWTGWMAVRERRGILAVLPCYAVLAVNALNAPSLDHVAVPEAVAVVFSLVVIGRVHLLDLAAHWRRSGVVALPGTERRFGRVTLIAAVALLVAALVVPPASTHDISGVFFKFNSSGGGHGGSGGGSGGSGGGSGPGTIRFDPSTIPGGPLVSQPQPVLAYTTDTPSNLYLRVVNDNYFNEGNWFPNGPSNGADTGITSTFQPTGPGQIPRDRDPADGAVATPSSVQPVTTKVVLSGSDGGSGGTLGIFPGEPEAINVAGSANGLTRDNLSALLTVDQYRIFTTTNSYTSTALVSTASADRLRSAGTAYPDFVAKTYLDLNPSTASDRSQIAALRQLANQWTVGQSNPYDEAAAIERHLRDTTVFSYTLKPPKTRAGLWPITDFLLRTHAGYCQYYASAMGALLRVEGIPARLVSGYGPGTADDSRTGSTLHQVTTSDAHVWVEAYFPTYGWVAFEPTPDGTYNPIPRGADTSPSTVVPTPSSSAGATPTPKPTTTPRPDNGAAAAGGTAPTIPPGLLGGVLAVLAIALLLVLLRNWIAHPRTLPATWRRVAALGAVLGVRRRQSETYAAYVARLCRALPPDTTTVTHRDGSAEVGPRPVRARTVAALEQLAAATGKAEFSASGLSDREVVQWRRAWNRVRRHVPLLLWRAVLARSVRGREPA